MAHKPNTGTLRAIGTSLAVGFFLVSVVIILSVTVRSSVAPVLNIILWPGVQTAAKMLPEGKESDWFLPLVGAVTWVVCSVAVFLFAAFIARLRSATPRGQVGSS